MCGFIAQLVEHRTGIARLREMGSIEGHFYLITNSHESNT